MFQLPEPTLKDTGQHMDYSVKYVDPKVFTLEAMKHSGLEKNRFQRLLTLWEGIL